MFSGVSEETTNGKSGANESSLAKEATEKDSITKICLLYRDEREFGETRREVLLLRFTLEHTGKKKILF